MLLFWFGFSVFVCEVEFESELRVGSWHLDIANAQVMGLGT